MQWPCTFCTALERAAWGSRQTPQSPTTAIPTPECLYGKFISIKHFIKIICSPPPANGSLSRHRRSTGFDGRRRRIRRSLSDSCKEVGNICRCECSCLRAEWSIALTQSPAPQRIVEEDEEGIQPFTTTTTTAMTTSTTPSSKWASTSAFTSISQYEGNDYNLLFLG